MSVHSAAAAIATEHSVTRGAASWEATLNSAAAEKALLVLHLPLCGGGLFEPDMIGLISCSTGWDAIDEYYIFTPQHKYFSIFILL